MQVNLTLPILFDTEETEKLSKLDLNYSLDDCEIKMVTFFEICAVYEYDKKRSRIFIPGDYFLCNLPKDRILELIKDNKC